MKSISRSILELIWNGLMVDVESILAPFGINVGSILEANSLTLRVVAVDPDESLPCYVVPCVFWNRVV